MLVPATRSVLPPAMVCVLLPSLRVKLVCIAEVLTAVIRPLAFTVIAGIAVALPNEPTLELTVSRATLIVVSPRLVIVAEPSTSPAIVIVGSATSKSIVPSES